MPAVATTVTVSSTREIKLTPGLRKKLLTELRVYQELRTQLKTIEAAMDKHKDIIGNLRADTGEQSISLEGFTVSEVAGVRSTLSKEKLISQGVSTAQIEMATVTTPTKPYTKVTCPKEDP